MSELAITARAKAREKVERLTRSPKGDVDASGWREPLGEQGMAPGVQTGPRPVSRRQFRHGGKVHGFAAMKHAGRKPRAAGGMTADEYQNRNLKEANESREGPKHVGGMKHGGSCTCAKCEGGRVERKSGGGNWIAGAIKHPGALHRATHTPAGEKIPAKKITKAAHSDNPHLAREAHLAQTLKKLPHKDSGGALRNEYDANKALAATAKPSSSRNMQGIAQSAMKMASRQGTDPYNSQPAQAKAHEALWKLRGGRPPRASGGKASQNPSYGGTRPTGDRIARAKGGRAKKGMNVNIIIAPPHPRPVGPAGVGAPVPPTGPVGLHQGMPPPMPPPGAAPPPMGMPPMARKAGGRTGYPIKHGAGGGKGRLEKIAAYGP